MSKPVRIGLKVVVLGVLMAILTVCARGSVDFVYTGF